MATQSAHFPWYILRLLFYCFHSSGTGTLGVPFAIMQGGYMAMVAVVIISVITNYTGKLIIECLYEKPFNDQGTRGARLRNSYALIGNFISY